MIPRRSQVVSGLIIAGAFATYGLYLLSLPESFSSPAFEPAFDLLPPEGWGAGFLGAAAIYAWFRRPPFGLPMAAVMAVWSANIGAATLQGKVASPAGWVWSACLALLLLVAQARGGR